MKAIAKGGKLHPVQYICHRHQAEQLAESIESQHTWALNQTYFAIVKSAKSTKMKTEFSD